MHLPYKITQNIWITTHSDPTKNSHRPNTAIASPKTTPMPRKPFIFNCNYKRIRLVYFKIHTTKILDEFIIVIFQ